MGRRGGEAQAYELELRLLDGKRQLDSRSVSVTPRPGVGLWTRIKNWITSNAIWLVAALIGLIALITLAALYHARRQGRPVPERDGPTPPPEPSYAQPPVTPAPRRIEERPFDVPAPVTGDGARVSLTTATYEELRALGMSMTQANRVLRYRERNGAFSSVDELQDVGGFPQYVLAEVKRRAIA